MNHSDLNKQTRVVWKRTDSNYKDSSDHPHSDNSNIIPFPTRPVPGKQPAIGATGARLISLSIRQVLHRTRDRVLSHIRMTNKPADGQSNGQSNGKCNGSAHASARARAC